MAALELVLALEYRIAFWGIFLAIALAVALWVPYLYKEIRRGKAQVGPRTPIGTGDAHPGRRGIQRLASLTPRPIRTSPAHDGDPVTLPQGSGLGPMSSAAEWNIVSQT
jgi:hypothetical protein